MYQQTPIIEEYENKNPEIIELARHCDDLQAKELVQSLFDYEQLHFQILLRFERERIATRAQIKGVNLTRYRQYLGTVWYYMCLCLDVLNEKKMKIPDPMYHNYKYISMLLEAKGLKRLLKILEEKIKIEI